MNSRKSIGRLGLVAGILAVVILGAYSTMSSGDHGKSGTISLSSSSSAVTSAASATPVSVGSYGPVIDIIAARESINLNFTLPAQPLPDGLTIAEIRGVHYHTAIIYLSSKFAALPNLDRGNMIITIERDNTTYVPASGYSSGYSAIVSCENLAQQIGCTTISQSIVSATQTTEMNVTVSGHQGVSFYPEGQQGFGRLTWWANGVHYTIIAMLPLSELIKIAESMNT